MTKFSFVCGASSVALRLLCCRSLLRSVLLRPGPVVCIASAAVFGLSWPVAQAATELVLLECSANAADERSIAECIELTVERSERDLQAIERNWQRLLDTSPVVELVDESVAPATEPAQASSAVVDPDVIAIVNDEALRAGLNPAAGNVVNVDESDDQQAEPVIADAELGVADRFSALPQLFRDYRNQHCGLEAGLFGLDRAEIQYQACIAALNNARVLQLTQSLAEHRAIRKVGYRFRGLYFKTGDGAAFSACDRKNDWWVTGSEQVLASFERQLEVALDTGTEPVFYTEFRGVRRSAPTQGAGANYQASIEVKDINLFRPASSDDCLLNQRLPASGSGNSGVTDASLAAVTVDDLGSGGFLYGYFNFWISACSVSETSVCSAETDAQFASDGEWKLRIDRSLERDWRVKLVPAIDTQIIEKNLVLEIDGAELFPGKNFAEPLALLPGQGVDLATEVFARELIDGLRRGGELRISWRDDSDISSELKFSLAGVTRALDFFNAGQ